MVETRLLKGKQESGESEEGRRSERWRWREGGEAEGGEKKEEERGRRRGHLFILLFVTACSSMCIYRSIHKGFTS